MKTDTQPKESTHDMESLYSLDLFGPEEDDTSVRVRIAGMELDALIGDPGDETDPAPEDDKTP